MKNSLDRMNGRLETARKKVSEHENTEVKLTKTKHIEKIRHQKDEGGVSEILNNLKKSNICVIRVTEVEKRKMGQIKYLK